MLMRSTAIFIDQSLRQNMVDDFTRDYARTPPANFSPSAIYCATSGDLAVLYGWTPVKSGKGANA